MTTNHDILLYHFTSDSHVQSCQLKGLVRGVTCTGFNAIGKPKFLRMTQWLTCNPDFNQSWNAQSTLPYDRTANRLAVCVPHTCTGRLHRWNDFGPRYAPKTFALLSMSGNHEDWYIYHGIVRPEWIIEIVKKPVIVLNAVSFLPECHHQYYDGNVAKCNNPKSENYKTACSKQCKISEKGE